LTAEAVKRLRRLLYPPRILAYPCGSPAAGLSTGWAAWWAGLGHPGPHWRPRSGRWLEGPDVL